MTDPKPSSLAQLAMFVLLGAGAWYGWQWLAGDTMSDIEKQVADDAITEYDMVKRQGSKVERCAQAGLVAAALLQAKDERRYAQWKRIESQDCAP